MLREKYAPEFCMGIGIEHRTNRAVIRCDMCLNSCADAAFAAVARLVLSCVCVPPYRNPFATLAVSGQVARNAIYSGSIRTAAAVVGGVDRGAYRARAQINRNAYNALKRSISRAHARTTTAFMSSNALLISAHRNGSGGAVSGSLPHNAPDPFNRIYAY